jgi:hypothetical protein
MHRGFRRGNLKEKDSVEVLNQDGRIILKCILTKKNGKLWTRLMSYDREKSWAIVNMAVKFEFYNTQKNS